MRNDGIEGQAEVHKQNSGVVPCSVQMFQHVVQSHVHCGVRGSVGSVHKLQGVQYRICNGGPLQVGQDKALQHLHDHRGQGDWSVVI